jgi:D-alanyl-D-alanine carboxypeptidase (penicillin-binding protein 5/6)
MDTIRGGEFGLANTNKLIRFYDGATGMKTGFTTKSGYCISATAKRNGLGLIAVVLKSPTSKDRFSDASTMLNYGFNMYENVNFIEKDKKHTDLGVEKGLEDKVSVVYEKEFNAVVPKGKRNSLSCKITGLKETVKAPIVKGQILGTAEIYSDDKKIADVNLIAQNDVRKISLWYTFSKLFYNLTDFIM